MMEEVPDIIEEVQRVFSWQQLAVAVGIFLLFLLFRKLFTNYVFKSIIMLSRKIHVDTLTNVLLAFEKPLRSFFVFVGLYASIIYFPFDNDFQEFFTRVFRTLIIVHVGWGLYNLTSSDSLVFNQLGKRLKIEFDDILLPFLSKLLRFAIIVMALSIIASEWNYNVSGFVAGLGLGGLAFALAAQDSIGNFFGGVIIITEKPFKMGDWIKTPSVEGFVEDITFRSTKIRTFADSLVTVPNSTLANEPIENMTKMEKREVTFNLNLVYATPAPKVRKCIERIESFLYENEDIDDELIIVRFNTFNESSLDLFLYFFTKPTGWVPYLKIKEEVNLKILEILDEEEVEIAFPSRSLYLPDQSNSKENYKELTFPRKSD
jgi:MscS family membrane protein